MTNLHDPEDLATLVWAAEHAERTDHPDPQTFYRYCEQTLSDSESNTFLDHVVSCDDCARELLDIKAHDQAEDLTEPPAPDPPEDRMQRMMREILGRQPSVAKLPVRTPNRWFRQQAYPIAATLALAVLAPILVLQHRELATFRDGSAPPETVHSEVLTEPEPTLMVAGTSDASTVVAKNAEILDLGRPRTDRSASQADNRQIRSQHTVQQATFNGASDLLQILVDLDSPAEEFEFEFTDDAGRTVLFVDQLVSVRQTPSKVLSAIVSVSDLPSDRFTLLVYAVTSEGRELLREVHVELEDI